VKTPIRSLARAHSSLVDMKLGHLSMHPSMHRMSAVAAPIVAALLVISSMPPLEALAAPLGGTLIDRVERVVDGDTVILQTAGRTRLIGINSPETVAPAQRQGAPPGCYGPEASARLKEVLKPGLAVKTEVDVEAQDRYGRALLYLYTPDGSFINGNLVSGGFARAKSYKPNVRYAKMLNDLQAEAKAKNVGLWGACESPVVTAAPSKPSNAAAPSKPSDAAAPSKHKNTMTPASVASKPPAAQPLENPGDTKNCGDFATYADAKSWFDIYYPAFGDVAKLDGNGDGIPCEALLKKTAK